MIQHGASVKGEVQTWGIGIAPDMGGCPEPKYWADIKSTKSLVAQPLSLTLKRKEIVGQYKEAGNKGRCCRTLERGSDEKHSLVYLHFVLNQYIFLV